MGFEINPVDGDLLKKSCGGRNWIRVAGCVLPEYYQDIADDIENFEIRDDDVWVCSFPKTGTTWTQEMVWIVANDLDYERAKSPLPARFQFFEVGSALFDRSNAAEKNVNVATLGVQRDARRFLDESPSPRFIKTHLPFNLLPRQLRNREKGAKIVYVTRNVKDTCISYFHHSKLLCEFQGDFDDFVNLFLEDKLRYTSFWTNVLGYWEQRDRGNVLFLKYEDMKNNLPSAIEKTGRFFDKNLTCDQVSTLNNHLSFANMKVNPAVNNDDLVSFIQQLSNVKHEGTFLRSGTSGQWKSAMTPEVVKRFDDWTNEKLKDTDFSI